MNLIAGLLGRALLVGGLLWPVMVLAEADTSTILLERLRADHAALQAAEADFHARRDRGELAGREATDYAAWVAGLHRRVAEGCARLLERGVAIPAGIDCPEQSSARLLPADIDQQAEQTHAEQTASLDAELLAGLGEFDEMLLQEQARVRAATPHTESLAASGGGGGAAGAGTDGGEGDAAAAGASGTEAREPTDGAGAGPGAQRPPRESSAPPGTPDGSDDDVVARQLREAAEKETDPELKKKLWEEYRKYKTGTQ